MGGKSDPMIRISQPVPKISSEDVERVLLREFAPDVRSDAAAALARYGIEPWQQSGPRVHMAILKLAQGQLGRLQACVEAACADPRDVIAAAEYPRYLSTDSSRLPSWWRRFRIFHDDWKEYQAWLLEATPARK